MSTNLDSQAQPEQWPGDWLEQVSVINPELVSEYVKLVTFLQKIEDNCAAGHYELIDHEAIKRNRISEYKFVTYTLINDLGANYEPT